MVVPAAGVAGVLRKLLIQAPACSAVGSGRAGKVFVQRGNRTFDLLAQAYDGAAGAVPIPHWKEVIIVEMTRGTAVVAPVDDPAVRELASVNQL